MSDAARPVGSTYRLQLGPTFDFAAARDVVRYVAALGVSHVYLSPLLTARPGSTHGYDVADPTTVSEQLGGEAGLRALADAAHAAGLGILADIVPNHLGTGWDTPLWRLLLAEGHSGEGGRVFDVDWTPALPGAAGKVIVPVLGDQYGAVLHRGELALVEEDGEPRLAYHDHRFPLSPESLEALARSGGIAALEGTPGVEESWQRLHALLEAQHYRLVHWRAGDGLINYRRFFAIAELAAVRVEDPHVFDATHDTILRLVADGVVDGLRVDHPDGLADPRRYLQRLAQRSGGVWTVVEKITHSGELLRDWDTAGTTGYEFCNDVLGLFVDPAAQRRFDELDAAMGASPEPYAEQVRRAKRETLAADLAADAARLARRLWALSQAHLDVRDVDDRACLEAVSALVSAFDVYRTYVDPETGEAAEADVRRIDAARAAVAATDTTAPALLVDFLADVLAGRRGNDAAALDLITRFQQLSGALTAKGVEDTVFYRYRRLVALNEVGGDPTRFGLTVDEFHARNAERAHRHPAGMVTTATHDTKRGEDVRLRIAALTQLGEHWDETLRRWAQRDGVAPRGPVDRQTASLVFQTMVAVWPFAASGQAGPDLGQRLRAYAEKAVREAGERSSWYDPDAEYEAAVARLIDTALDDDAFTAELGDLAAAANEIAMVAGLAQLVLRCTAPGVPDTYQGNELWDDSLVDPDNRRPVDFGRRAAALADLRAGCDAAELWAQRHDGRVKLWVLHQALTARREAAACVGDASGYRPLAVTGRFADHVVAYARTAPDGTAGLVAVAPRLPGAVMGADLAAPLGERWDDTAVALDAGAWTDRLTGRSVTGGRLADLLATLPVALLVRPTT